MMNSSQPKCPLQADQELGRNGEGVNGPRIDGACKTVPKKLPFRVGVKGARSTPEHHQLRPRVFARCLLGPKSKPTANAESTRNRLRERDLNGAQGRNRTTDTLIFSHT